MYLERFCSQQPVSLLYSVVGPGMKKVCKDELVLTYLLTYQLAYLFLHSQDFYR